MLDPSHICDLHHNLQQCQILNPLSKAKNWTHILMDTMSGSQPAESQWELPDFFLFCFVLFCLFRATPAAYGGSQARDRIRTVATGLCHSHSNIRSEWHLRRTSQLMATPDPQPLKKTRDQTCVLMDTSQIRYHWGMTETHILYAVIFQQLK